MWPIEGVVALLIAPHGLTDLWALPLAPMGATYAVCCALGALCPQRGLPLAGAVASTVHFAMDLGWCVSSALVLFCILCHASSRDHLAYCALVAYMLAVHLPIHYLRVAPVTPVAGWLLLAAFTAGSWKANPLAMLRCSRLWRRAAVTLIAAHTVANLWAP
jgi:hypothetical protein